VSPGVTGFPISFDFGSFSWVFPRPGPGTDYIFAGGGNDVIYGGGGADFIYGGAGDDQLYDVGKGSRLDGGAGNDIMEGLWGDTSFFGGSGNDNYIMFGTGNSVFEGYGNGKDAVYVDSDFTLPANVEDLFHVTFYDYNNPTDGVRLTGNGLDNRMGGGKGADLIRGLGGNDTIYGGWNPGGNGVDVLIGGPGQDRFVMLVDRSYIGSDGIVLRAGDGAPAFQRPGPQAGDVFDFTTPGYDRFWDLSWGGTTEKGEGFLWLENSVGRSFDTLVFASLVKDIVDDPNDELIFVLRIEDGPFVVASDYSIDDFIL